MAVRRLRWSRRKTAAGWQWGLISEQLAISSYAKIRFMTQPQATAEIFWTAYKGMKPAEREAFLAKLMTDKRLAEDLKYAAVIEKRRSEPTVSLDDYLTNRSKK